MPALGKERISVLEKKLVDAAFRGEWAEPSQQRYASGEEPDNTVRGSFIRKLLLGLTPISAVERQNQRVRGVRLRKATIKGEIDLSDCIGPRGAPLPPLLLEGCIIDGSEIEYSFPHNGIDVKQKILSAVKASNARLSRLSLFGCQIAGRVDLTDATLDGDLEFKDLKPLNDHCICQMYLRRCRIDGSVIAQKAYLRIPDGQRTEFNIEDYALNLASAEVHGSVWLQPDFCADGGVSVRGAGVGGNIWATGAWFRASDELAFQAESLRCDGTVALCGTKNSGRLGSTRRTIGKRHEPNAFCEQQCELEGKLRFLGAEIGDLDLRGIHVVPKKLADSRENMRQLETDSSYILSLSLAHVQRNFRFECISASCKSTVEGWIDARGMTVGGYMDLSELELAVSREPENPTIDASNLRVGGDLTLNGFNSRIDLTSSHVEHNLIVDNSPLKAPCGKFYLQAPNITIDNDCYLNCVSGILNLQLSRISGALTVYADRVTEMDVSDAEVRGSVIIGGSFHVQEKPSLRFDGSAYLSGFCIGILPKSLTIVQSSQSAAAHGRTSDPILSIENARIENNFRVGRVEVETDGSPVTISLCGLKARVFEHAPGKGEGTSWDFQIELQLNGFEYDRIDKEPIQTGAEVNRVEEPSWYKSPTKLFQSRLRYPTPLVKAHKEWLSIQKDEGTASGYEPQPYEQLARALRNDGKFEDARHITFRKLSIERQIMQPGLARGFFYVMEKFFDYGLFLEKSVKWFVGLWLIGALAFHVLNYQRIDILFIEESIYSLPTKKYLPEKPLLVLHSPAVSTNTLALPLPESKEIDGPPMGMKKVKRDDIIREWPCYEEVDSFWYALDVFVPLLDLKQEDKCSITTRKDGIIYRGLSTLYEIIGAIVTPIMLLSVSGLLRRYVEERG